MAEVYTYSSKEVVLIVGTFQMRGLADGDFLTVSRSADAVTKMVGADGTVTRSISADETSSWTIRLQQTSPSNATLQTLLLNKTIIPIAVKDLHGDTLISAEKAWVATQAEASFAMENGQREWRIDAGPTNFILGGNE